MAVRPAFLQVLLSRRVVRRTEAEQLHAAVARALNQESSFEHDIEAANADLARISLEIRACNDPKTGEAFLLLVNTKGDALAEIATPYSAVELVYIKSVIEAIVTAPDARFAIPSTAALQLAPQAQLTKRAASDLLQNLEQRSWLQLSRTTGHYTLTLRALNELDAYIRNEFEEHVLECAACFALVTHGEQCATDGCRGALHTACKQWLQGGKRPCPLCQAPWHATSVGEA